MLNLLTWLGVFLAGLVVLYFGAEGMLKGAVGLARRFGISPFVIGLTLVAFGTSCPETFLDVSAAARGESQLAFGDLVGSNIANLGLILGVAAIVCPLKVRMELLRAEVPIVIATSILVLALAADGTLSRQDGWFLLAGLVIFLGYVYRSARAEAANVKAELTEAAKTEVHLSMRKAIALVVIGLAALVLGSQLMVYSAVETAKFLGLSTLLIGLTIVALGTSLPELAASISAARRSEADIVVGNVIGSNIFNMLFVLALVTIIHPFEIPTGSLRFDLPVMVGLTISLVPIMLRGMRISRKEGIFLVLIYTAFLAWQANAVWHDLQADSLTSYAGDLQLEAPDR